MKKDTTRKLNVLMVLSALSLSLLTGCGFNITANPRDDGNGVDIQIVNQDTDTEEKKQKVTEDEDVTEERTEEDVTTEDDTEEDTEETTQEEPDDDNDIDVNAVLNPEDYDYVSQTGIAFNCSEALTTVTDSDSYASYTWDESSMFELTLEDNGGTFTLSEEIDFAKDAYITGDNISIITDDATTTLSGHDEHVLILSDEENQYYQFFIWIDTGREVKTIRGTGNNDECLKVLTEITSSITYLYYN